MQALRRCSLARHVAAIVCGALLLAQALALWHTVAHGPAGARFSTGNAAIHAAHDAAVGEPWAHAAGDAGCRLVDQVLVGLLASWPAAPASAEPCPLARPPVSSPAAARRLAAAYLARAPPSA